MSSGGQKIDLSGSSFSSPLKIFSDQVNSGVTAQDTDTTVEFEPKLRKKKPIKLQQKTIEALYLKQHFKQIHLVRQEPFNNLTNLFFHDATNTIDGSGISLVVGVV